MTPPIWRILVSEQAQKDFVAILKHSQDRFGQRQRELYQGAMYAALRRLAAGPHAPGSREREEIAPGLRSLHVGGRGRHIVFFKQSGEGAIQVLRILHEAMDFERHIQDP